MQQIPFIDLFKSALHVSGDKLAHPQDYFLTVHTAFGTMHWYCWQTVTKLRGKPVSSQPCHRSAAISVHCTKKCIYSQKVLLRMSEYVARNM